MSASRLLAPGGPPGDSARTQAQEAWEREDLSAERHVPLPGRAAAADPPLWPPLSLRVPEPPLPAPGERAAAREERGAGAAGAVLQTGRKQGEEGV